MSATTKTSSYARRSILIRTAHKKPKDFEHVDLSVQKARDLIGARVINMLRVPIFRTSKTTYADLCLIVDEEAAVVGEVLDNWYASLLYGETRLNFLCGDVILTTADEKGLTEPQWMDLRENHPVLAGEGIFDGEER